MGTSNNRLQQFISLLEEQGELVRITAEADPVQEIAAITDRVCKQPGGGRALLFEKPVGSDFSVATNLFGSLRRVCISLGVDRLEQLSERVGGLLASLREPGLADLDRQIAVLPKFAEFIPQAPVEFDQELVTTGRPDLTVFPFLQNWPNDGAEDGFSRYITLPLVFTTGPDGSKPNCGMYRCQLRGPDQLAIRWKEGSGAAGHLQQFGRLEKRMPVAVVLGGPPAVSFSAMFPLPGNLDEMAFAGFLRNDPIGMSRCREVPLQIPAGAEVLIEGYVDPSEVVTEGPFGNHTGFYSASGPAALMRVTTVSHRPDAIIPATVVGPPPMEDCWMAKAWEAVLLAFLQRFIPQVKNICFPLEWVFHQSAVIYLDNPDRDMVRETAGLLWGMQWFFASKLLIFVDAARDNADMNRVAWHSINMARFEQDLFYDQSGLRLGLDATGTAVGQNSLSADNEILRRIDLRWREYGIE